MGGQHPAGRKGIARALDGRFQIIAANLLLNNTGSDDNNSADIEVVGTSASLLAFRMNPALLHFYTSSSSEDLRRLLGRSIA